MIRGFASLTVLMVAGGLSGRAETVTNRPVADTTLFEYNPDGNLGGAFTLICGATANGPKGRALLRFAFTNLPPAATVQSVELRFNVVKAPQMRPAEPSFFELRRVLQAWGEGDKTDLLGAAASAGEATWNSRLHSEAPWSSPGGNLGTDVAASASGSVLVQGVAAYQVLSNSNLVADVQGWLNDPSSNHGWMLRSQSEQLTATARRIGSREDTFSGPQLVITFAPAPGFLPIQVARSAGGAQLGFSGEPGVGYRVLFRDELETPGGPWLLFTNVPASPVPTNFVIEDPALLTNQSRFYQIVSP